MLIDLSLIINMRLIRINKNLMAYLSSQSTEYSLDHPNDFRKDVNSDFLPGLGLFELCFQAIFLFLII